MDREKMLYKLVEGKEPLDVAINKWEDIANVQDNKHKKTHIRHPLDEGPDNCALCEVYGCGKCPLFLNYKVKCDDSLYDEKKYDNDFYRQFMIKRDADIMINALKESKKKIGENSKLIDNWKNRESYKIRQKAKKNKTSGEDPSEKKFNSYQNPGVDEASFQ